MTEKPALPMDDKLTKEARMALFRVDKYLEIGGASSTSAVTITKQEYEALRAVVLSLESVRSEALEEAAKLVESRAGSGPYETPQTDALAARHEQENKDYHYRWHDYDRLARQLERELTQAEEAEARNFAMFESEHRRADEMTAALTQAQSDLGLERESHEVTKRMLDDADHELTEGRARWAKDLERANQAQARCAELEKEVIVLNGIIRVRDGGGPLLKKSR